MLNNKRQEYILKKIQKEKFVNNKDLINELYVSEATLRRDLSKMELHGYLERIHGGAVLIESSTIESSLSVRMHAKSKEKKRIAEKAVELMKHELSYFFDSSSTVGQLIPIIQNLKDITVITNGLNNAHMISIKPSSINLLVAPGKVSVKTSSILGSDTINYINNFSCHMFLFSCSGMTSSGITEASLEQSIIKQAMLKHSKVHVLLVDSSKFGKMYLSHTCSFDDIDYVITDKEPPKIYIDAFHQSKTKYFIV